MRNFKKYRRMEIQMEECHDYKFSSFVSLQQQSNKGHPNKSNKHEETPSNTIQGSSYMKGCTNSIEINYRVVCHMEVNLE